MKYISVATNTYHQTIVASEDANFPSTFMENIRVAKPRCQQEPGRDIKWEST